MAVGLVAAVEGVMLMRELELHYARGEFMVLAVSATLTAVGREFIDDHAHRHAGAAVVAIRAIGEGAAAAKAGGDQMAVGGGIDQVAGRGHLGAGQAARQIAAGIGCSCIELQIGERKIVELAHASGRVQEEVGGIAVLNTTNSCRRRVNSLRAIGRAPKLARWRVSCWQSISAKPSRLSLSTSATRATLERSEEHTSELQSHSDIVCRLLLEKQNKIRKVITSAAEVNICSVSAALPSTPARIMKH